MTDCCLSIEDLRDQSKEPSPPPSPSRGVTLDFQNISYWVVDSQGQRKEILSSVTGRCRPGRLLALMGPSGAGKTSLIGILMRQIKQNVTGKITVNGKLFKSAELRRMCSYVPQLDVLLATATVKEAVTTSALLRLPPSMDRSEKEQRVRTVIEQLELQKCSGTLIGDAGNGFKGCSGGERRRLSVAISLVTDPSIVLLDEPTSGLDSETAVQLIDCLKKLTGINRTVIASIHQPSSQITAQFDDLLLLNDGKVIFSGYWADTLGYFATMGLRCPAYTNIADFLLASLKDNGDSLAERWAELDDNYLAKTHYRLPESASGVDEEAGSSTIAAFPGTGERSPQTARRPMLLDFKLGLEKVPIGSLLSSRSSGSEDLPPASWQFRDILPFVMMWMFEVRVLFVRFVRTWYRAPNLFLSFVSQYLFSGTFIGLMYIQLGTTSTSSLFDRQASLFLILVMLGFTPSNSACTIYNAERALLRREAYSGVVRISSYFVAKTLTTLPIQAFVTTLFSVLTYYIIGYQDSAAKYLTFLVTIILFQLTSENIGIVAAIVTKTATLGLILVATIMMILTAFSGFLISRTPVFFRWIPKMSFVSFAYSAIYQNEFDGLKMTLPSRDGSTSVLSGILVDLGEVEFDCLPTNAPHSKGPSGNDWTIAQNIAALLAILIGLKIFTFLLLSAALKYKRL